MNEPAKPQLEQREVHYEGRVQGVGFRYRTLEIATSYAVTGFVQNLFDGKVVLVAEGVADELDRFLADIERQMHRNMRAYGYGSDRPRANSLVFRFATNNSLARRASEPNAVRQRTVGERLGSGRTRCAEFNVSEGLCSAAICFYSVFCRPGLRPFG